VWKWLIQVGQDRGGFYSYACLENLFGLHVRNADHIVAAWQHRTVGEFIPAAHSDWLGGRLRDVAGWKVGAVEPGRLLVLNTWGSFILLPQGEHQTHFLIRSLNNPELKFPLVQCVFGMLVFEPAHIIMQRKMMLEIKRLSEQMPQPVPESIPQTKVISKR
jgi:hypothetical protein